MNMSNDQRYKSWEFASFVEREILDEDLSEHVVKMVCPN